MAAERLELRFFGLAGAGPAGPGFGGGEPGGSELPGEAPLKSKLPCSGEFPRDLFVLPLTIYFPKQVILEPDLARVARRDVPADRAVEKSAFEQEAFAQS